MSKISGLENKYKMLLPREHFLTTDSLDEQVSLLVNMSAGEQRALLTVVLTYSSDMGVSTRFLSTATDTTPIQIIMVNYFRFIIRTILDQFNNDHNTILQFYSAAYKKISKHFRIS